MPPKVAQKIQSRPGSQSQRDLTQVGSSEIQPQPQAHDLEVPTLLSAPGVQVLSQPHVGGIPELEPQPETSSEMEPQPGPSSKEPQLEEVPQFEEEDEEPRPEAEAVTAQILGELEAEAGIPKPPFQVGDQVLCLHGSLLYEAKCLRVAEAACGTEAEAEVGPLTYLIHYTGWNKNWDEWVSACRVFQYSDANLARQSELLVAHRARLPPRKKRRGALRARKTPGLPGDRVAPPAARRKRSRGGQPSAQAQEAASFREEVRVEIPELLKPWLVDDWDLVTKQNQLYYLPAAKTVDSILEDYAQAKAAPGVAEETAFAVVEVVAGIKEYFNVMLGTQLLYKFERPQYAQVLAEHPGVCMSQIYGAPHLLRLFVRIGAMLAYTPLDDQSLALLLGHLHDFVGYLAENCATLFSASDYGAAPPEYHDRVD
ncbi:mortality factor 4-like protein 1 [Gracilinanus agilis]|uniref:mortality factor 4-like protein 1 n=1 Tax=Gracilinanus agilis TaxID=191870 RepID=UPI001CFF3D2A|nr:mortality factor 4-like protein 1 [Gracilinanus agilis]